jgi:hypothetical protein
MLYTAIHEDRSFARKLFSPGTLYHRPLLLHDRSHGGAGDDAAYLLDGTEDAGDDSGYDQAGQKAAAFGVCLGDPADVANARGESTFPGRHPARSAS